MTRSVRDEYGFLLVPLTDEERLQRMDNLAARQVMVPGSRAFIRLTLLLRGQICRDKLTVDEREAKEKARNKRYKRGTPRSSAFIEVRDARAAMSPEEIRVANADYWAKDREKKRAYRMRPEVRGRAREIARLARLRQGVPVRRAMPTEAALPTPTLADGLTWSAWVPRARPGDESYHEGGVGHD